MKRIYISGPMTGMPEFNFPAFNTEADQLAAQDGTHEDGKYLNEDAEIRWQKKRSHDTPAESAGEVKW